MVRTAVIPAAGTGLRALPLTANLPKVLLEVGGKPLLLRNIELLRDQMGIEKFILITGYQARLIEDSVRAAFPDLNVEFIECPDVEAGLARGLLLAKERVHEPFVTVLGDEVYLNSDHRGLQSAWREGMAGLCGMLNEGEPGQIAKNYALEIHHGRITRLIEKPNAPKPDRLGVGSYVLDPLIFDFIETTPPSLTTGRVELTEAISRMAEQREVRAVALGGQYFNVNSVADYHEANYFVRSSQFSEYKVSVIVPTRNEEGSIASVVRDFRAHAHEVLVVDNQSTDATVERASFAGARILQVRCTGYGDTIRQGFDHAEGDILVVVEGDHSFRAKDLGKILEYLKDSDMVVGTRTTRQLIEQGANMRGLVRFGNVVVGFILSLLWLRSGARFTDVGCTYRGIWRDEYRKMAPGLRCNGPEFSTEMMVAALNARRRLIEVPVSYFPRVSGESKHSKDFLRLSRTALRMLVTMFSRRLIPPRDSSQSETFDP